MKDQDIQKTVMSGVSPGPGLYGALGNSHRGSIALEYRQASENQEEGQAVHQEEEAFKTLMTVTMQAPTMQVKFQAKYHVNGCIHKCQPWPRDQQWREGGGEPAGQIQHSWLWEGRTEMQGLGGH